MVSQGYYVFATFILSIVEGSPKWFSIWSPQGIRAQEKTVDKCWEASRRITMSGLNNEQSSKVPHQLWRQDCSGPPVDERLCPLRRLIEPTSALQAAAIVPASQPTAEHGTIMVQHTTPFSLLQPCLTTYTSVSSWLAHLYDTNRFSHYMFHITSSSNVHAAQQSDDPRLSKSFKEIRSVAYLTVAVGAVLYVFDKMSQFSRTKSRVHIHQRPSARTNWRSHGR